MNIIDRYIGKQVLLSTLFAVVVLSFVLVLGNVLQKMMVLLVQSEVPLSFIFKLLGYILPFTLVFTIPWGFLTAILLTFGRMSADNELVSLRMAGLSVPRICAGVFVLSLLFGAVCLIINVSVAPKAEAAMGRLAYQRALENPLLLFEPDQVSDQLPSRRIYVGGREGNELTNFQMVELEQKKAARFVFAEKVIVNPSEGGKELNLEMRDAVIHMVAPGAGEGGDATISKAPSMYGVVHTQISLEKLAEKANRLRPSQVPTSELFAMAKDPQFDEERQSTFRVEAHKRFSFSLASLTFALIGIPLGITAQRRETSIGFVISLIVAVVYFMFIILAETFKKDPDAYPHLLMWLPNVVFLSLGVWMFWRLSRR